MVVEHSVRRAVSIDAPIDNAVAVSPDGGHYLALQTRPRPVIWIMPGDGEPFSYRQDWAAYRPRWAASGDRVGFIAAIGPPRVWTVEVDSASGRAIEPPRMLIRTSANAFAFSPDGDRIALVVSRSSAAGASEVRIIDWKTRASSTLLHELGVIYWLDWSPNGAHLYYGLVPPSTPEQPDPPHFIRRAGVRGEPAETITEVSEFLGLSPDGKRLLYRPLGAGPEGADLTVEVSDRRGIPLMRFSLPEGPPPRWGADSNTLLQVRRTGDSAEILEIPVPE